MIDIKVGEKSTKQVQNIQNNNHIENNEIIQLRYLRDSITEHNQIERKQKRYANCLLTIIAILLFINTLPTILKILLILAGATF